MKRGDIVLAVLTGELGKPRPAVIVQADQLNGATSTLIICPITSDTARTLPLRPFLAPSETNGLRTPSQIMTDKIIAAPLGRIRRVIGTVDADTMHGLDQSLLIVLGLPR